MQDEVGILRDTVNVMEPKLARLEPELNLLRNERDGWHSERMQMDAELSKLRPIGRVLMDLSTELQELNELATRAGNEGRTMGGSPSPGKSASSLFDQGVSLSQRHSLWVGLPSLRALNATLYENIRRLAHDLHTKESHCSELIAKLHHVSTEMESTSRSNESQWAQLTRQQEASSQTIQRLSDLVSSTERELNALRSHRITVDQIRSVLASYPGKFLEQKLYELMHGAATGNAHGSSSSIDDSQYESKRSEHHQSQYTPLVHRTTLNDSSSPTAVHHTRSDASPTSTRESVEAMLNKVGTVCIHTGPSSSNKFHRFGYHLLVHFIPISTIRVDFRPRSSRPDRPRHHAQRQRRD